MLQQYDGRAYHRLCSLHRIRYVPKISVDGLVLIRQGVFGQIILVLVLVCGVP